MTRVVPTAQTSFADIATTPRSSLLNVPGLGLCTSLHEIPFQCRIIDKVRLPEGPFLYPTAQASLAEIAATLDNWFSLSPPFGLGTMVQLLPSQCSVRVS